MTQEIRLTQKQLYFAWRALAIAEQSGHFGPGTDVDVSDMREKIVSAFDLLHSNETGCDVCDMEELFTTRKWEDIVKAHAHHIADGGTI